MTFEPARVLAAAQEWAAEAGRLALEARRRMRVEEKACADGRDLVTNVDREIEALLTERVQSEFPGHQILGEENGVVSSSERPEPVQWVIDPIDGTFNYAAGIPFYAVSIGVCVEGTPQVGVVELPGLGEQYAARRGGGAFCNGERIEADRSVTLATGLIDVGGKRLYDTFAWFGRTGFDRRLPRLMGCAALSCAFVAAGRLAAFAHASLSPWDLAAGALIAEEAGAAATDFEGRPLFPDRLTPFLRGEGEKFTCLIAAPGAHAELMDMMRQVG